MISIIITHHFSHLDKYLQACIKSALLQKDVDKEIIVMAASEECPKVPNECKLHYDKSLVGMSEKINYAINNLCSKDTEGYLLLSDDVVISPGYAAALSECARWYPMLIAGFSNNDNMNYYCTLLPLGFQADYSEDLVYYALSQPRQRDFLIAVPFTPFYAIYIKKEIWDKVGELDNDMSVRFNDVDFTRRALSHGVKTCIHTGVFVLHFGSKSLAHAKREDFDKADKAYYEKYGNIDNTYEKIREPIK